MKRSEKVIVYLSPEAKAEFEQRAEARGMSLSAWAQQAMRSYERMAKRGERRHHETPIDAYWPSGYPKNLVCIHCKQACHDPVEAHPEMYPQGFVPKDEIDFDRAMLRRIMKEKYDDTPSCGNE